MRVGDKTVFVGRIFHRDYDMSQGLGYFTEIMIFHTDYDMSHKL